MGRDGYDRTPQGREGKEGGGRGRESGDDHARDEAKPEVRAGGRGGPVEGVARHRPEVT